VQDGAGAALKSFPPRSVQELAAHRDVLLLYASTNWAAVLVGWVGAYLAMQTFAVPGEFWDTTGQPLLPPSRPTSERDAEPLCDF
jgi:hypothetical protein